MKTETTTKPETTTKTEKATEKEEARLIDSLLKHASDVAKELDGSRMRYYGLDYEDIMQEVLLAHLKVGREWKPRVCHEGRYDELEASRRTYCWKWGKVRAGGGIRRKYARNLRRVDKLLVSMSSPEVESCSCAVDPFSLSGTDSFNRKAIEKAIVGVLFAGADSTERELMHLLMERGWTNQKIADRLGLRNRQQVSDIKKRIRKNFFRQIKSSGENIKCSMKNLLKELQFEATQKQLKL